MNASRATTGSSWPAPRSRPARSGEEATRVSCPPRTAKSQYMRVSSSTPPRLRIRIRPRTTTMPSCDHIPGPRASTRSPASVSSASCARYSAVVRKLRRCAECGCHSASSAASGSTPATPSRWKAAQTVADELLGLRVAHRAGSLRAPEHRPRTRLTAASAPSTATTNRYAPARSSGTASTLIAAARTCSPSGDARRRGVEAKVARMRCAPAGAPAGASVSGSSAPAGSSSRTSSSWLARSGPAGTRSSRPSPSAGGRPAPRRRRAGSSPHPARGACRPPPRRPSRRAARRPAPGRALNPEGGSAHRRAPRRTRWPAP